MAKLAAQQSGQADHAAALRAELAETQREQAAKQGEKDAVVALFRKGRISEAELDRQYDDIAGEEVELGKRIAELTRDLATAQDEAAQLAGAEAFLREVAATLDDGPVTPAKRRRIVEQLVHSIMVRKEIDPETGLPRARAIAMYRFDRPDH